MRIAYCLEYPLGLRGGVSVLVENLMIELSRRGHEIVLVSPDIPEAVSKLPAELGVRKHICWNPAIPHREQAKKLAKEMAATGIDLAHFHLGGNYGWGNRFPFQSPIFHLAKLDVPVISSSHLVVGALDGYCGPQKPLVFKLAMFPLSWLAKLQQLRSVRYEIAVSQHDLQKLRRWYTPLRNRFVQIYHSRLQAQSINPPAIRQSVILNVGHLAWRKGQLVLAESFVRIAKRYPEWILQFAGHDDGSTATQINRLAQQHQLENRIQLLGERNDVRKLMNQASIYVQPSYQEALGLALQEALFSGCPSIGSRTGGIPELIEDSKTGILVQPGNILQLSAALEKLISNPPLRHQWGLAAAHSIRAKGMTLEAMVEKHLNLYEAAKR